MQARIFVALVTFMLPGAALAQLPLVIDKHFSPVTIPLNGSTTLTFDVTNNVNVAQSGIAFTDPLPTGLVVATPNGLTGSCGGGSITATAGSSSISLSGATLPAVASCTFSVNVTGVQAGVLLNTTSDITSDLTLGNPASATLTVVAPPTLTKFFDGRAINVTVPLNGTTSLTFTLTNPNVTVPVTGIGFTDTLPAGLVVATPNGVFGTCTGTVTAISGSNSIMLAGASLGTGASCTFTVDVTGTTVGTKNNTTSTVGSTEGGDGPPATATVTVLAPPTITKAFGGAIVTLGAATPLTFTVANPNPTAALAGVAFTDTLPAGLLVSTPNGLTGSCGGGTITAVAGSSSISLTGATLAASASCTFSVSVTGTSTGTKNNTTSTVTSTNGGTGLAASASILVLPADAVQIGYSANLKAGDST